MLFERVPVVVRGGGDLASGVIYRLVKAGFPVIVTELARPLAIRRAVAYASAVFEGEIMVEGLMARRVQRVADVPGVLAVGGIPVLVDDVGTALAALKPAVVVDARLAKRNLGTTPEDAPLVIALGPGFEAGRDCHAVIETNRGHALGRVVWNGGAEPNTGTPGNVQGHALDRVLRAPCDGHVTPQAAIGDQLRAGDTIAAVGDLRVVAPFDGVLRGLIHPSVAVTRGMKIGDVDPRAVREHCFTMSDKSLAVGGGVLEAILSAAQLAELLRSAVR
ncbi:MAG TPA: selenium-dependent molybdenum cofactor biosynthesis protein YqeB [Aggregatilineaceae bacterium]|nr:selenium-dependent molybdenum cofactor biosynthesis protein YqeB [Aggregatilineaceae bacterium]